MIKFEEEMIDLKKKISEMASLVEDMIGKSIKGLKDRNMILAQEVIDSDNEVNNMEVEIDNLSIKILALYHPEAGDLRVVTMIMKINNDLERIGDHAVNIAKMSIPLSEQPPIKPLIDIPRMADKAIEMLKESLDSFMKLDSEMAVQVCIKDDEVDALEPQIVRELLTYVMSDSRLIDRALRLIFIARNLERVADLATNIAEDAFYIATGDVLKHHHLNELN
jgi:phosphate transport system protein